MSDPSITFLTARRHVLTERVARSLVVFIFIASLLCVLFATLFPFDFSISAHSAGEQILSRFDWRWNPPDPHHEDRIENILLFMPLGFGVAALINPRRNRAALQFSLALLLSFFLTSFVETSQTFVSFRDPSMADIWCNTLGGVLGAVIYIFSGDWLLNLAAKILLWMRPIVTPLTIGGVLLLYALFQLAEPLILHNPGDLSVWDPTMQLAVGNAPSNDRGWLGNISQLAFADRAASPQEINSLFAGDGPDKIFGNSLLANFQFGGTGPFRDLSGQLQPLNWFDVPSREINAASAVMTGNRWLLTRTPMQPAIDRIARSSQFTLAATIATIDPQQHGSEQIIDIASSLRQYNLQIAQEYHDVILSLRTAMRTTPNLRLRDVLPDTLPHQLVITVRNAQVNVYVDGNERGRVEISPEAKVIWRLYPRGGFTLRVERYAFRSYAAIYRLFVYIPFSALLAAMLTISSWSRKTKRIVAAYVLFAMAISLEIILGLQSESGFQMTNLLIALMIGFGVLGAMSLMANRVRAA